MIQDRHRFYRSGVIHEGCVVYWMDRDQRVEDNWALLQAQRLALDEHRPFVVVYNFYEQACGASTKAIPFMKEGLARVQEQLQVKQIPFIIMKGDPIINLPNLIQQCRVGCLVTDFHALKEPRHWREVIAKRIHIPFWEVDAHNIVPCVYVSDKQEFHTHTFRTKLQRVLPYYLCEYPEVVVHPYQDEELYTLAKQLSMDQDFLPHNYLYPSAHDVLATFLTKRLARYDELQRDPNQVVTSELSRYLHFGQISSQRVALEVMKANMGFDRFLDQLIVRKELADNFCFYNPNYDSFDGFPAWAKDTLTKHRIDHREYLYTLEEFEQAKTHDPLWNAAMQQAIQTGYMHGYMRMYWAKKILEWTNTPEEAVDIAIVLNNTVHFDGCDPVGYNGIAWSIGGVHDRPWSERAIFGKIRYMNYEGAKRKFDIHSYIERYDPNHRKLV